MGAGLDRPGALRAAPASKDELSAQLRTLETEIAELIRQSVERDQLFPALQDRLLALPYADSEYRFHSTYSGYLSIVHGRLTVSWRNHALAAAIDRNPRPGGPAPRELPAEHADRLGMGGRVPVIHAYLAVREDTAAATVDEAELDVLLRLLGSSRAVGLAEDWRTAAYSPHAMTMLREERAMRRGVEQHVQAAAAVAVLGRRAPIYQAYCLSVGAQPVTIALDRAAAGDPRAPTISLEDLELAQRRFDRVLASPLVARRGLGATGTDLDPDGDLALMARLRRLVAPTGLLLLCVPTGVDLVLYNLSRVYGPERLPLLLQGWSIIERIEPPESPQAADEPVLSVFVLRPA